MSPIIALVPAEERRTRVRRALPGSAVVRFCTRGSEIPELLSRYGAAAVITELVDADMASIKPVMSMMRSRLPELAIIVVQRAPLEPDELLELGTLGVSSVADLRSAGFASALRRAVDRAEEQSPAAAMTRVSRSRVPRNLHRFFEVVSRACRHRTDVRTMLRSEGLSARTVRDQLRRAALPPPRRVIAWCRLLHAAWRLDISDKPLKAVAAELGYGTTAAIRNHLKRHAGLRVGELRERGGFAYLLELFAGELSERPSSRA